MSITPTSEVGLDLYDPAQVSLPEFYDLLRSSKVRVVLGILENFCGFAERVAKVDPTSATHNAHLRLIAEPERVKLMLDEINRRADRIASLKREHKMSPEQIGQFAHTALLFVDDAKEKAIESIYALARVTEHGFSSDEKNSFFQRLTNSCIEMANLPGASTERRKETFHLVGAFLLGLSENEPSITRTQQLLIMLRDACLQSRDTFVNYQITVKAMATTLAERALLDCMERPEQHFASLRCIDLGDRKRTAPTNICFDVLSAMSYADPRVLKKDEVHHWAGKFFSYGLEDVVMWKTMENLKAFVQSLDVQLLKDYADPEFHEMIEELSRSDFANKLMGKIMGSEPGSFSP